MKELRITPRAGFTMTVDRRWALELFEDMKRSDIREFGSSPTTHALYLALLNALKPVEPVRVPELLWGPGKWSRTSSRAYVWRRRIVSAHEPARVGPVLARIERLESGLWKPWVFPYGESDDGRPTNVVDWRRPTRTLWEAKDVACDEFVAQRKVIEQG